MQTLMNSYTGRLKASDIMNNILFASFFTCKQALWTLWMMQYHICHFSSFRNLFPLYIFIQSSSFLLYSVHYKLPLGLSLPHNNLDFVYLVFELIPVLTDSIESSQFLFHLFHKSSLAF